MPWLGGGGGGSGRGDSPRHHRHHPKPSNHIHVCAAAREYEGFPPSVLSRLRRCNKATAVRRPCASGFRFDFFFHQIRWASFLVVTRRYSRDMPCISNVVRHQRVPPPSKRLQSIRSGQCPNSELSLSLVLSRVRTAALLRLFASFNPSYQSQSQSNRTEPLSSFSSGGIRVENN